MQLRYLECISLFYATKKKEDNGVKTLSYKKIDTYKIISQEIQDEISATVYGASISKMLRISSVNSRLETYLQSKINNKDDNISKYYIEYKSNKYKIKSVKKRWIDMELL